MNKIEVVNDDLNKIDVDDGIKIELYKKECLFDINEMKISVIKDSSLEIQINLKSDSKLNISINVRENTNLKLNILTNGHTGKIKYTYILEKDSSCNILKFQNVDSIKEMCSVKLLGENATFNFNLKTISNGKETYDYYIYHDSINTISNIKNNGVAIKDGLIIYQVSSFVPKNISGCVVNQNNRIINLTNNKCKINPNLYIDCNDVEASHSALIGKFSDEEIFYLESRGIDYNNAQKLLITGFMTSDIESKKLLNVINKNINKYWG